jgi:hypothetical protein
MHGGSVSDACRRGYAEAGLPVRRQRAEPWHFEQVAAAGEWAVLGAIADDVLRDASVESGDVGQQLLTRC